MDLLHYVALRIGAFDEELVSEAVLKRVQQKAIGGLAVTAGPSCLLVIRLERPRHRVMQHQPHVRLVDAHAEGVRGHDHADALLHERVLHFATMRIVQPSVIGDGGDACVIDQVCNPLDGTPRRRVDDGKTVRGAKNTNERFVLVLLRA